MSDQQTRRNVDFVALIEACSFRPHYSGEESTKFWTEVRKAKHDRTLYDFACALQDVESRLLAVLNAHIEVAVKRRVAAVVGQFESSGRS